jgi:hypothetical protein
MVDETKLAFGKDINHQMTIWADDIIQSAKQLMFDGEAYLVWTSGLPWYRRGGDAWGDESWWIETALARYERRKNSRYWLTDELAILTHHFPDQYRHEVRSRIDQWNENDNGHDPEYWWHLASQVYPEHVILQELHEYTENDYQRVILAKLGCEDVIANFHDRLLAEVEAQDWYWVDHILSHLASAGQELIDAVVSKEELKKIRGAIAVQTSQFLSRTLSNSEQPHENNFHPTDFLESAVLLNWQEVVDAIATDRGNTHLPYSALWLSLTNKAQFTQDLVLQHSSQLLLKDRLTPGEITGERMAFAIAWKRATQQASNH